MKPVFTFSTLLLSLMLGGCISLLPDQGPRPKQIILEPQTVSVPNRDLPRGSIAVSRPTAPTLNEENRLVIHYDKDQLNLVDHISGVTYQDNLPDMVQRHMVKAMLASKKFNAVGFATDSFKKTHILESDINSFAIHVTPSRMFARVQISAKLLDHKSRQVIWQKQFMSEAPIKDHQLKAFVPALKEAYQSVLYQIAQEI